MYRRKISKSSNKSASKLVMLIFIGLIVIVLYFQRSADIPMPILQQAGSQTAFASEANQSIGQQKQPYRTAPLILQTEEQWAEDEYGFGGSENTLAMNGCAIASLAMVLSYWENRTVIPSEIINWSQNRYYVEGAGTAWSIFEDFGLHYQFNYLNLGNDLNAAETYLRQGIPVIVSVSAGNFTDDGHIMVLRDWNNAGINVNDPNDNQQKSHYQQSYDPAEIAAQTINYWVYTR